jgi:putative DNA primase/helicase
MVMNPMTVEQFEDLWYALDVILATGSSTVGRIRKDHEGPWPTEDDVSQYLVEKGLVLRADPNGVFHVECPWKDTHTTPNTLTGTSYFAGGGFRCCHSHCTHRTVDDFLREIGWMYGGFDDISGEGDGEFQQGAYQLLTTEELATRPRTSWCIKGVLPQHGLAAIFGPSGSGKSFLVIDLAMALASGQPWFGFRTKPCPVVYCALEGEGGVPQRVEAYRTRHDHRAELIRFLVQPFNLLMDSDVEALVKAITDTGCGGGVAMLDTLNRAAPGTDENDSKDMGKIIVAAKKLQMRIGGLVILVHHTGKDVTRGLRGHSSLLAALDCAIEVSRGGGDRSWCVSKSKDGQDGTAKQFRLEVVPLGKDADGDPITSCVIVPIEGDATKIPKVKMPRGANQKIILNAVRELLQASMPSENEVRPECVPFGRSYIRLEEAIAHTSGRLLCQPDQRNRSTTQAVSGLVGLGLLEQKEGWLWEP